MNSKRSRLVDDLIEKGDILLFLAKRHRSLITGIAVGVTLGNPVTRSWIKELLLRSLEFTIYRLFRR